MKLTVKEGSNISYSVNEKKGAVTCKVISKGEEFFGIAKVNNDGSEDSEKFDVERGKIIAYLRAEIAQRKADYDADNEFLNELKEYFFGRELEGLRTSKIVMHAIQKTSESMSRQSLHMHLCMDMLKAAENGVEFVFDEKKYGSLRKKKHTAVNAIVNAIKEG